MNPSPRKSKPPQKSPVNTGDSGFLLPNRRVVIPNKPVRSLAPFARSRLIVATLCETISSLSIAAASSASPAPQPQPPLPSSVRVSSHKTMMPPRPTGQPPRIPSFSGPLSLSSPSIARTASPSLTASPATEPSFTVKTWASNSAQSSAAKAPGNSRFSPSKQLAPP